MFVLLIICKLQMHICGYRCISDSPTNLGEVHAIPKIGMVVILGIVCNL